ncbi:hypothetical protein NA57DRAFT_71250 [Rhizodiscina lignyota]|uniref:Protein kinase domain-containing protein n=1 Tax=Rhizodiscina lignyota TaxID=1504668 RepID=A0A9P4MH46_9PEZI|nr:hypothetical protein NA57DRAFT_71250 [Rhizodiscina lignyota]
MVAQSLRSETILLFRTDNDRNGIPITDPVLAEFNFAGLGSPSETSEHSSGNPQHDIYRYLHAMCEPSANFDELLDVYSLGTILVEIVEWRALRYLVDSVVDVGADNVPLNQLAGVRPSLLSGKGKGETSKLKVKTGDIHTEVRTMCLSGKAGAENEDERNLALRITVLDIVERRLQQCNI